MLLARLVMLGTLGLGGCTVPNEAHCGNQAGDATCSERFGSPMFCDVCVATNDGCVDVIPEEACRVGERDSGDPASDTSTGTSTDPTTGTSASSSATTMPLSTAGPGESSAESTSATDDPGDSTGRETLGPTDTSDGTATESTDTTSMTTGDECTPALQPCEDDDECCEGLVCGAVTHTCGVA